MTPQIIAVNYTQKYAILDDGRMIPVTHFSDQFGDETNDPISATIFITGNNDTGWYTELTEDFPRTTINRTTTNL